MSIYSRVNSKLFKPHLPQAYEPEPEDYDFEVRVFEPEEESSSNSELQALPYRLLSPKAVKARTRYPLVIFLHGAGERGSDNQRQLKHFVRSFAGSEVRRIYPCFVAVPQVCWTLVVVCLYEALIIPFYFPLQFSRALRAR
jgi:predicted peptidase